MNILSCAQKVSGRRIRVTNARSMFEGMGVSLLRGMQEIGKTEISYVHEKKGEVVLRNDIGARPGDLLMCVVKS